MLRSSFTPILTHLCLPINLLKPRFRNQTRLCLCTQPVRPNVAPASSSASASIVHSVLEAPRSAYVHLPFCRKRCHYCDFPIVALGSAAAQPDDDPRIHDYIRLLSREIMATKDTPLELETVFFGGGTPSLVPPGLVSSTLELLDAKFGISSEAEISMEMDPGTFNAEKLIGFMELGVNRVSLGVQAFQDELLKACGRAHGVKEVHEAIEIVKSCGVRNWSMDLISSLPHQTMEMWEDSLRSAIAACPNHISVYDLQVERGTKFHTLYTPGEFPLPSDELSADFYRTASRVLSAAGYAHYEISSYSLEGYECKHNSIYWKCLPFYGFGLGAASYVNGSRFSRPKRIREYTSYVQNLEDGQEDEKTASDRGRVDLNDLAMDIVMLSLRTSRGLNLTLFRETFGASLTRSIYKVCQPYVESGHIVFMDEDRRILKGDGMNSLLLDEETMGATGIAYMRLTDPDGFLLSNELISHAFGIIAP